MIGAEDVNYYMSSAAQAQANGNLFAAVEFRKSEAGRLLSEYFSIASRIKEFFNPTSEKVINVNLPEFTVTATGPQTWEEWFDSNSKEIRSEMGWGRKGGSAPNNGFYGAPLSGEMYVTDNWGALQTRHHNGLDIVYSNNGQIRGENIYAPVSGKIVRLSTTEDGDAGGVRIRIRDANGDEHALYHMQHNSNSHLKGVTSVVLGQKIGTVGSSGKSTGPHLHYEIWKNGNRNNRPNPATINPYLQKLPLR